MTRIYISAGEPSADAHAAAVANALRRRLPGLELEALGGPLLERAGVRVLDRMEAFSVVDSSKRSPRFPRITGCSAECGARFRQSATIW